MNSEVPPVLQRPVLLLVDDEEQILSALRRTLRKEGYEIVTAESPRTALRILEEREVDPASGSPGQPFPHRPPAAARKRSR